MQVHRESELSKKWFKRSSDTQDFYSVARFLKAIFHQEAFILNRAFLLNCPWTVEVQRKCLSLLSSNVMYCKQERALSYRGNIKIDPLYNLSLLIGNWKLVSPTLVFDNDVNCLQPRKYWDHGSWCCNLSGSHQRCTHFLFDITVSVRWALAHWYKVRITGHNLICFWVW